MKIPRIVSAIENIDDELVSGAAESKKKKNNWVRWGSLAACFALVVIAGIAILPSLLGDDMIAPEETDGRYKDFTISTENVAIVWPWEYLTESERYYETEFNGVKYEKGSTVSEELIGEKKGSCSIVGYDGITDEQHTAVCDVYQLKNVDQTQFIAVKITDSYYIFKNAVYDPPKTLGALFERVDLSQFLKLERFSENGDGPDAKHFVLNDDDYVWEVLSTCKNADFIDMNEVYWHPYERDFISFAISSEVLGIYKHSLLITADGYLETNAFDWGYLYYIGEEASDKIIKYAMKNSTKAEYEPYDNSNSICGEIVEITDDYILVDDSILCKDEKDGITYKILINDIRISRYVDRAVVKVGDTVEISYNGEIEEQNSNTISSAFSISDVDILYEDENEEQEYIKHNYNEESSSTASKEVNVLE